LHQKEDVLQTQQKRREKVYISIKCGTCQYNKTTYITSGHAQQQQQQQQQAAVTQQQDTKYQNTNHATSKKPTIQRKNI